MGDLDQLTAGADNVITFENFDIRVQLQVCHLNLFTYLGKLTVVKVRFVENSRHGEMNNKGHIAVERSERFTKCFYNNSTS